MKKGKNAGTIGAFIGILLSKPLFGLISETMGSDISDMVFICLGIIMSLAFIGLAVWVFKQKRYATVVGTLFMSIGFFTCAYAVLKDNELILIIAFVILIVSGCIIYFSAIRFNKKHGINR